MDIQLYNFCGKCGAKNVGEPTGKSSYNTRTGQEYLVMRYRCPNKKHFLDGHIDLTIDTNPSHSIGMI